MPTLTRMGMESGSARHGPLQFSRRFAETSARHEVVDRVPMMRRRVRRVQLESRAGNCAPLPASSSRTPRRCSRRSQTGSITCRAGLMACDAASQRPRHGVPGRQGDRRGRAWLGFREARIASAYSGSASMAAWNNEALCAGPLRSACSSIPPLQYSVVRVDVVRARRASTEAAPDTASTAPGRARRHSRSHPARRTRRRGGRVETAATTAGRHVGVDEAPKSRAGRCRRPHAALEHGCRR